jgi:hypothetical protein
MWGFPINLWCSGRGVSSSSSSSSRRSLVILAFRTMGTAYKSLWFWALRTGLCCDWREEVQLLVAGCSELLPDYTPSRPIREYSACPLLWQRDHKELGDVFGSCGLATYR